MSGEMTWPAGPSEMARRIRELDWHTTSLGPTSSWPQSLRTAVELILASGFPSVIHYGPDGVMIYNDRWSELVGEREPAALGRPASAQAGSAHVAFAPWLARARAGETVTLEDEQLSVRRGAEVRSISLSLTCCPLRSEAGSIAGVFVVGLETSERICAEFARRESRYRTLFESIDEGFCIIEVLLGDDGRPHDYRFVEANPAFEKQTGLVEAVGKTVRQLVPDLDPAWLDVYGKVASTGLPIRFEMPAAALGRHFDVYAFRIGSPHERRVAVLFTNIVERKRTVRALREAAQRDAFRVRLADALRSLADPLALEEAAARALGEHLGAQRVHYGEIIGDEVVVERDYAAGVQSVVGRHRIDDFGRDARVALRTGRPQAAADVNQLALTASEQAKYAALHTRAYAAAPVIKDGHCVAVIGVHSTTPRAWTADELALISETAERTWGAVERARAEAALRDSDRRKDEFLAMLAHELRNPLAPLRTALEVIRLSSEPVVIDEMAAMMQRQVNHMVRLVDDLLDVSRVTRGKITLQKRATRVRELVEVAVEANRAAIEARGIELRVRMSAPAVEVTVDATRMTQVLSNVLHNAHKFTPPGGRIDVSAEVRGTDLVLAVKDTGAGISPEVMPQIFDLFTQGDRGASQNQGGLGIGLSLARRLVELHGGRIEAHSEGVGRGSEFIIRLPMSEHPVSRGAAVAPVPAAQTAERRVLIIDDNRDAAQSLSMLVAALGGVAHVAYAGEAGAQLASEIKPHVVLLDIGMPGIDGYETCRRIRSELGRDVSIIAVTGWGQGSDKQRAMEAGFDAHVTKPPDLGLLRRHLGL